MAEVLHLSKLRRPPVIGRTYLVPTVEAEWMELTARWPVRGPKHNDLVFFNFDAEHYHVDPRFIPALLARTLRSRSSCRSLQYLVELHPLHGKVDWKPSSDYHIQPHYAPLGRVELRPMRCVRRDRPYVHSAAKQVIALNSAMADRVAVRSRSGQILCPHRKYDLSQQPIDPDGTLTCPLHGLRVCVRDAA